MIEKANKGIMQISDAVQKNADTAERSTSSGRILNSRAELLRELTDKFRLLKYDCLSLTEDRAFRFLK